MGARNGIQGFGSWVAVRPADRIAGKLVELCQRTRDLDLVPKSAGERVRVNDYLIIWYVAREGRLMNMWLKSE